MLSVHLCKRRCRSAEHVRGGSFRVLSFWVNVPVKNRRFKKIKLEGLSPGGLYNTIQYITIQYNTCQYNTLHYIHYIAIHETTIHDITLQYISLHCNTLQNITLNYIAVNDVTLHYIQKDKHTLHTLHLKKKTYIHYTLHTLHTLHYILFHCIALHFIRTDRYTYIHMPWKISKTKIPAKKKQSIPMWTPWKYRNKITIFHTGLNPPDLPSLADGCKAIGNVCELHTLRGGAKSWRSAGNMVL